METTTTEETGMEITTTTITDVIGMVTSMITTTDATGMVTMITTTNPFFKKYHICILINKLNQFKL
jgi:hypothetical protein